MLQLLAIGYRRLGRLSVFLVVSADNRFSGVEWKRFAEDYTEESVAVDGFMVVDLSAHLLGDGESRRIVGGRVDAKAGRKFLNGLLERVAGRVDRVVRLKCRNVVVDYHTHRIFPPCGAG
jgi:hypothetical protein